MSATPGKGSVRGFVTKRFGSTSTHPSRLLRTLAAIRPRSRRDAVGRRIPTEFTQSTRLLRARMRMICVLLVGSPPQSLAKHTMDWRSSIGRSVAHTSPRLGTEPVVVVGELTVDESHQSPVHLEILSAILDPLRNARCRPAREHA